LLVNRSRDKLAILRPAYGANLDAIGRYATMTEIDYYMTLAFRALGQRDSATVYESCVAASAFLSFPLGAQRLPSLESTRSITTGYFLGLALENTILSGVATGGRTYSGGGLNGELGYGFTPEFAAFIDASVAGVRRNDTGFGHATHVDVGLRFHFADPARRLIPFAELALTQRAFLLLNIFEDQSRRGQRDCEPGLARI